MLARFATEFVTLNVDVIVAVALRRSGRPQSNRTHPIVTTGSSDPVWQAELVASLARPGGNITSMSLFNRGAERQAPGAAQRKLPVISPL